jgi:hypothetical protein
MLPRFEFGWRSRRGVLPIRSCLLLIAALLPGCGDRGPQPVPVSGTVLIDGTPLHGGTVRVVPENGRAATGQIQPDGRFSLTTFQADDGCYPGTHAVEVFAPRMATDMLTAEEQKKVRAQAITLAEKYTDFRTSGLTVTIDKPTDDLTIAIQTPKEPRTK